MTTAARVCAVPNCLCLATGTTCTNAYCEFFQAVKIITDRREDAES